MSAKQILVTGGTGFIGSHTVVELIRAGYEVIIADNLSNSNIKIVDQIEKINFHLIYEKIFIFVTSRLHYILSKNMLTSLA